MSPPPIDIPPGTWPPDDTAEWLRERVGARHEAALDTRPALADRLDAHLAEAWTAFSAVYGADAAAAEAFVRAVDAAVDAARARPAPSTGAAAPRPTGSRAPSRSATPATSTDSPARSAASATRFRT